MKTLLTFLAAILLAAAQAVAADSTPFSANGRLHVEGTRIVNEAGQPVQLRGVSMGWHCLWPRFYTTGTVGRLAGEWGADIVRCAVGVDLNGIDLRNRPELAYAVVDSIVNGAVDNGIYALIDFHSHPNNMELAKEFFTNVTSRYGNLPNLLYEIWNEPTEVPWSETKDYARELIPVIRRNAPDAIIVVPTPRWDQEVDKAAADPIADYGNIVYALHYYAATHTDWLRDRAQQAVDSGLPVFISECASMEHTGDGPIDAESWQKWMDFADANGIGWIAWSVSDKEETCSMLYPTAASDGSQWQDSDYKPWALMVKESLRKGR